jgi:hypothetical protein
MTSTDRTVRVDTQEVGDEVVQSTTVAPNDTTSTHSANKSIQIVKYIAGVIALLIGVRFVLLLLGARNTGIVQFVYSMTEPFVAPYYGILGQTISYGPARVETASIFALIGVAIIAFIVIGFIRLLKH